MAGARQRQGRSRRDVRPSVALGAQAGLRPGLLRGHERGPGDRNSVGRRLSFALMNHFAGWGLSRRSARKQDSLRCAPAQAAFPIPVVQNASSNGGRSRIIFSGDWKCDDRVCSTNWALKTTYAPLSHPPEGAGATAQPHRREAHTRYMSSVCDEATGLRADGAGLSICATCAKPPGTTYPAVLQAQHRSPAYQ